MIRVANSDQDAFSGLELFSDFYKFTDLSKISKLDKPSMYNTIKKIIEMEDGELFLAEDESGNVTGGICIHIMRPIYCPNIKLLLELFWYILPEYRGKKYGSELMRAAEKWSVEHRCDAICFSNMGDVEPEKAKMYFEHLGYKPCEQVFWKFMEK